MTAGGLPGEGSDLVAAARTLLSGLGLSLSDLLSAADSEKVVPTFAEYVPVIEAATTTSSADTWSVYWRVLVAEWGDRRIDEPTSTEIMSLAYEVQQVSALRRNSRGGYGAMANFIDAVRCLYKYAVADKYLSTADNPSTSLKKPLHRAGTRRALSPGQIAEINEVAASTGLDPELDILVLRLLSETACRRGGAMAMRPCDLDRKQCTVRLREKGTVRDQPVSPTLMAALVDHAEQRIIGGFSDVSLLRNRRGLPVSKKYFDQLWQRLGQHRPWIRTLGVTSHWLRYTTLTWVERNFSYAVAAAFAGHFRARGNTGNTLTYVKASIEEVATAVAMLTGEPHPLATSPKLTPAVDR